MLNIAGLPVYRDAAGGVGTPTSDNERTKMEMSTKNVLVLVNGYDGKEDSVRANAEYLMRLFEKYAQGRNSGYFVYR